MTQSPIEYLRSRLAKAGGPEERTNLVEMITWYEQKLKEDKPVGVDRFLKP